jgi:hypothetical protein
VGHPTCRRATRPAPEADARRRLGLAVAHAHARARERLGERRVGGRAADEPPAQAPEQRPAVVARGEQPDCVRHGVEVRHGARARAGGGERQHRRWVAPGRRVAGQLGAAEERGQQLEDEAEHVVPRQNGERDGPRA